MGLCARCGNQTTWLRRIRINGHEYCSVACRDEKSKAVAQPQDEAGAAAAIRAVKAVEKRAQRAAGRKAAQEAARREQRRVRREETKLAEAELDRRLATHLDRVSSNPTDPYVHLDLAAAATKIGATKRAEAAYVDAIALAIPDPKTSGLAKRDYADLLWNRKRPAYFGGAPTSKIANLKALSQSYVIREMKRGALDKVAPDVIHYLREADADLRRHLRSAPDDIDALEATVMIARILQMKSSYVEERLKQVRARARLLNRGATPELRGKPKDVSGVEFENMCLSLVKRMGLRAELTKTTGDGGIDIIAYNDQPLLRGKYLIQCKDWENAVGEPPLRDLLGVVAAEDAVKGILITSGTFTEGARRFAAGKRLELIDGKDLRSMSANLDPRDEKPT